MPKQIVRTTAHYTDDYEACPLMFHRKVNLKRGPASAAPKLALGSAVHNWLAHYYRARMTDVEHGKAVEHATQQFEVDSLTINGFNLDESTKVINNCTEYADNSVDRDEGNKIISVETKLSKVLYEDDDIVILYEGTIDLIIENSQGLLEPWDHKSETSKYFVSGLGNQFIGYCFLTDQPRMVRNAIGLQKTKSVEERCYRQMFAYAGATIEWWKQNTVKTVRDMLRSYETGSWPGKLNACDTMHHFTGCPYRQIELSPPDMHEEMLENDFVHVELYS